MAECLFNNSEAIAALCPTCNTYKQIDIQDGSVILRNAYTFQVMEHISDAIPFARVM